MEPKPTGYITVEATLADTAGLNPTRVSGIALEYKMLGDTEWKIIKLTPGESSTSPSQAWGWRRIQSLSMITPSTQEARLA